MTNYDIECEYTSTKKKLLDIMDNDEFQTYSKENEFEQLFYPFDSVKCQYYDANEFISANRNGDGLIFSPWISAVNQNMVVNL